MSGKGWKETILQQQSDLQKLEAMDADMNDEHLDIEKYLRKPKSATMLPARSRLEAINRRKSEMGTASTTTASVRHSIMPSLDTLDVNAIESNTEFHSRSIDDMEPYLDAKDDTFRPRITGEEIGSGTPRAPETTIRYQKARLNILQKQLDDGQTLRKQMSEQIKDLQKQLTTEREENKTMRKRVSTVEVELKRLSSKKGGADTAAVGSSSDTALHQEILSLKKDVGTAEKMVKQSETQMKSKDLQLKRAAETISKLTSQVAEMQTQTQRGVVTNDTKLSEAEARIDVLEKQRAELVSAFKKQMKLIDVLKRQKIHVEAARLLNFTEEEFMKTLDWTG